MKVLLIAKAYPPDVGGVQYYTEFLARAYLRSSVIPVVVSLWDGPRGWHDRIYPEGTVRVFNVGKTAQIRALSRMLGAVRRLLKDERFDFIQPTTWRPAVAALPFVGDLPMVLSVHAQEVLHYPRPARSLMIRVMVRADLVVTVSHSTMQVAREALRGATPRGQWEVDFNGLSYIEEARAFARPARDPAAPVRILSFGRLAERKNFHGCLQALARLRDAGVDNFHYTIAGTGPLKDRLTAQIVALGLGNRVSMAGYVADEDVPDLYRSCDVFLHPQTAPKGGIDLEGFGLAIADSISFGAAAIVGEAGGPKDFVKHGERGLVVDGEDIGQIADALRQVLTDPALRHRLATTGRAWCLENLSWDRHAAQILVNLTSRNLVTR